MKLSEFHGWGCLSVNWNPINSSTSAKHLIHKTLHNTAVFRAGVGGGREARGEEDFLFILGVFFCFPFNFLRHVSVYSTVSWNIKRAHHWWWWRWCHTRVSNTKEVTVDELFLGEGKLDPSVDDGTRLNLAGRLPDTRSSTQERQAGEWKKRKNVPTGNWTENAMLPSDVNSSLMMAWTEFKLVT